MKNIKTYEEFEEGVTFKNYTKNYYDLPQYTSLKIHVRNLINLDGIEVFTNLETFYCSENKITSLKPIENSIKLEILGCFGNRLTSLKGVENLIKLKELSCRDNEITSLEPIKNLINLMKLWCYNNKITSLKPILNLTKLYFLFCDHNPIDWIDYIDKKGNTWYIVLPKSITILISDRFDSIDDYWKFMDQNQPVGVSRKFNF